MGAASLFEVGEDVEYWRVLVHLSILAFCLVVFESTLHKLEHKFPPSKKYQHMLKKAYRELMVLGFISLGLKLIKEIPGVDSEGKTMLAFQVADLTIFLLALALIVQTTGVFLLLRNQNDRAECAELLSTQDLVNEVERSKGSDDAMASVFKKLFCCNSATKTTTELVELRLLRRLLLSRFGLPQLFPYSKYLNQAQANQIEHMIEVEPMMWVFLLLVAWAICGLLEILRAIDTEMPASHELVESCMVFAWVLLLMHVLVYLYFRSCIHHLLHSAAFSYDKTALVTNLTAIAEEEAEAWKNEEADKALEIMARIQEHHEELERHRERVKKQGTKASRKRDSLTGIVPASPPIHIRYFSHKAWHVGVMLLLLTNGFLITLFIQCAVYDMGDIYIEFGTVPTIMVPLPLIVNALILQRRIFYDFVVVSNTLQIDSHTLSDVVEKFSEVVRLRSEFGTTLAYQMTQLELSLSDLEDELKLHDPTRSGFIDVDDLRDVLAKFGFRITRYRFNSVAKLLFNLHGTTVACAHVVRLVLMAQSEDYGATMNASRQAPHPLVRPSGGMFDTFGHSTMLSHANYEMFNSTRQSVNTASPCVDEMARSSFNTMRSSIVPKEVRYSGRVPVSRHSLRSQSVHEMFNLGLSDSHPPNMVRL